jgi:hypothetical protein
MPDPSDLYEEHLSALKNNPINMSEPSNGGMPVAQFFACVVGMGERARKSGTIARMVRDRNKS